MNEDQEARIKSIVEAVRKAAGPEMVASRREHEDKAEALLNEAAGVMDEDQALRLGKLFNTAMWGGTLKQSRFAPAFHGATIKRLILDLDLFNHWTRKLWSRDEDEALDALDQIVKDKSKLPGAGRSFPSMVFYIRDRDKYSPWMDSTAQGIRALLDTPATPRAGGADSYKTFCARVKGLRDDFGLEPQEVDAVLAEAFKRKKAEAGGSKKKGKPGKTPVDASDLNIVAESTCVPIEELETWVSLLRGSKRQALFYGPPGTGKTFVARKLAEHLAGASSRVLTVQFHPSFSYEDFVEGLRPSTAGGQVQYQIEPGVFLGFCDTAKADPKNTYVMVVDEINRADLGSVLGELMLLLEYRGHSVRLPYSKREFSVPENVVILATMNTADRSLALVDFALRRRFHSIHLLPSREVVQKAYEGEDENLALDMFDLVQKRVADPDFAPGHSYWLVEDQTPGSLIKVWEYELKPYLREFWFEHPKELDDLEKDVATLLSDEL